MNIKPGDKIKVLLLSSNHSEMERISRGIYRDCYTGKAVSELKEGQRFVVDTPHGELRTSAVVYIGENMFTTKNSSYYVEKVEA